MLRADQRDATVGEMVHHDEIARALHRLAIPLAPLIDAHEESLISGGIPCFVGELEGAHPRRFGRSDHGLKRSLGRVSHRQAF